MLPFLLLTAIGDGGLGHGADRHRAAAGSSWQLAAAKVDYQSALLLMAAFSVAVGVLPLWLLKRKRAKREKERRAKNAEKGSDRLFSIFVGRRRSGAGGFFGVLMGKFYLTSTFIISAT